MAEKTILENFTNSENNNMIDNIKNTIHNKIIKYRISLQ